MLVNGLDPSTTQRERARATGRSLWLPGLFIALIIAANWFTIVRTPSPWQDEVFFVDPAVNLAQGYGFGSGWWPGQPREEVFASNAPLYSLIVAGFIAVAGLDLGLLRALNWVLLGAAGLVLIVALRRLGLFTGYRSELLFIFLLYGGAAMTAVYRSARYDVLGLLICAVVFAVATSPRRSRGQVLLLAASAALIPAAGLHLIPFVLAACVLRIVVDPDVRRGFADGTVVASGMAVGGAALVAVLAHFGVARRLWDSATVFSAVEGPSLPDLTAVWTAVTIDPSSLILLAALLAIAVIPATRRHLGPRGIMAALGFGLLIPVAMTIIGRFHTHYVWMSFIPLAVMAVTVLARLDSRNPRFAMIGLLGACLVAGYGLPGRFYLALKHWQTNDPAPLTAAVQRSVSPGEVVLATPLTYFAAREVTPHVFGPSHFWWSRPWHDGLDFDVLLLAPVEAPALIERLGGDWRIVDGFEPKSVALARDDPGIGHGYHRIVVYRRVGADGGTPVVTAEGAAQSVGIGGIASTRGEERSP